MFGYYEHNSQIQILEEIRKEGLIWIIDTLQWDGVEQARYELKESVSWVDDYDHFVLGYEIPEQHKSQEWEVGIMIEEIILEALKQLLTEQEHIVAEALNKWFEDSHGTE